MDTKTKRKIKKDFQLPKEFAEKWLAALRSGEYTQIDGTLISSYEDDDGCSVAEPTKGCCLGIAALVCNADPENLIGAGMPKDVSRYLSKIGYPEELLTTATVEEGVKTVEDLSTILASLNDGFTLLQLDNWKKHYKKTKFPGEDKFARGSTRAALSFTEIADWVSKNVEFV